jgi:hypothetical protein
LSGQRPLLFQFFDAPLNLAGNNQVVNLAFNTGLIALHDAPARIDAVSMQTATP